MRNVYLLCYDVADDKRLRKTYKKMRGFGDPVQYSVFRCELSPTEKQVMKEALWEILDCRQRRQGAHFRVATEWAGLLGLTTPPASDILRLVTS